MPNLIVTITGDYAEDYAYLEGTYTDQSGGSWTQDGGSNSITWDEMMQTGYTSGWEFSTSTPPPEAGEWSGWSGPPGTTMTVMAGQPKYAISGTISNSGAGVGGVLLTATAAGQTAVTDTSGDTLPYTADSYTKLLLHMNGADAGTTFTDDSASAHTCTAAGATTVTGHKVFGSAGGSFPGGTNRLTIPDSADWTFGSGDFTVEAWVYPTTFDSGYGRFWISQAHNLADNANRSWGVGFDTSGHVVFYYTTNGMTDIFVSFGGAPARLNTWQHLAVCRSGSTIYAFLNGALLTSQAFGATIYDSSALLCIGSFGQYAEDGYGNMSLAGYLDELRVSKGVARWTTDFNAKPAGCYALQYLADDTTWRVTPTKTGSSFSPAYRDEVVDGANVTGVDFTVATGGTVQEGAASCAASAAAGGSGGRLRPGAAAGPVAAASGAAVRVRPGAGGATVLAAVGTAGVRAALAAGSGTATSSAGGVGQRLRLAHTLLTDEASVAARGAILAAASAVAQSLSTMAALGERGRGGSGQATSSAAVTVAGTRMRSASGQAGGQSAVTGGATRMRTATAGSAAQTGAVSTGHAVFSARIAVAVGSMAQMAATALHHARALAADLIMLASGRLAPMRLAAAGRLAPSLFLAHEGGDSAMDYLGTKEKTPEEIVPRRWSVDFGPNLLPGETLTTATIRVRDRDSLEDVTNAMVQGPPVVEGSTVSATFTGGASGRVYAATIEVTTSAGAVNEEVFLIAVRTPPGM